MLYHKKDYVFAGQNNKFFETVPSLVSKDKNPNDIADGGDDHCADEWRHGMIHEYSPPRRDGDNLQEYEGSGAQVVDDALRNSLGLDCDYSEPLTDEALIGQMDDTLAWRPA